MNKELNGTTLLIVDDDRTLRHVLAAELRHRGLVPTQADSVEEAEAVIESASFDAAIVDLRLPDGSGLDLVRKLRQSSPRTEVIVLTGHGTVDTAVEAMQIGAFDYMQKPAPVAAVEATLRRAMEHQQLVENNDMLRGAMAPPDLAESFVGRSARFSELKSVVERIARSDTAVLITGETGTGKEVVAKLIHAWSGRRSQPLVTIDCASLHEDLLNNELFGHERGAYTGAAQRSHGLFKVADGGTVFLDEIGDVSQPIQAKLLRVLETGTFRPVGSTREISVDIRILAATNRDLPDMIDRGLFRSDLFFRLNTIRVEVPSLRERREDIAVLATHFLERANARYRRTQALSDEALAALTAYDWPGNVRELVHVIERAVVMSATDVVGIDALPAIVARSAERPAEDCACGTLVPLADVERAHILSVVDAVGGNRGRAAGILGIGERTLYRKLRSYGR